MMTQKYKPGEKVILSKDRNLKDKKVYRIITASPVYSKISYLDKLKTIFNEPMQKEIINYKYRCKSSVDMNDFLQEEIEILSEGNKL